ncbi:MAG: YiiX/YebB-like N1pC/P60 family cysteine hydrolase [Archangium sp.]|nr:YiiX/YebB-like N1pC/P60 family cysteine hydrolase [Archangium sp.]
MGLLFRLTCLGALIGVGEVTQPPEVAVQSGDVVLQASTSERSALIRKASRSPYSHVGVIEVAKDGVFVIEAVQPVSRTPLSKWVKRGEGGWVTVLRAKGLDVAARNRVVTAAKKELGKPYDARYRWDDERLYCSELVVKAFARGASLSVGQQEVVKTLELSDEELALAAKLGVSPSQTLVTPGSLVGDEAFEVIAEKSSLSLRAEGQGEGQATRGNSSRPPIKR